MNAANAYYPSVAAYYGAPSRVCALAVPPAASQQPPAAIVAVDMYSGLLELEFKPDSVTAPQTFSGVPAVACSSITVLPGFRVRVPGSQLLARVELFDPSGRRLAQTSLAAGSGEQEVVFKAEPVGAGVYFIRYRHQGMTTTLKTMFVR